MQSSTTVKRRPRALWTPAATRRCRRAAASCACSRRCSTATPSLCSPTAALQRWRVRCCCTHAQPCWPHAAAQPREHWRNSNTRGCAAPTALFPLASCVAGAPFTVPPDISTPAGFRSMQGVNMLGRFQLQCPGSVRDDICMFEGSVEVQRWRGEERQGSTLRQSSLLCGRRCLDACALYVWCVHLHTNTWPSPPALPALVQELAAKCLALPDCCAFTYSPFGRDGRTASSGTMKGVPGDTSAPLPLLQANWNPRQVDAGPRATVLRCWRWRWQPPRGHPCYCAPTNLTTCLATGL